MMETARTVWFKLRHNCDFGNFDYFPIGLKLTFWELLQLGYAVTIVVAGGATV